MNRGGRGAEALAAALLERAGLTILARNYRCRFGEIDLVAQSGPTLVFVEVRARRSEQFGGAAASITRAKRRRLLAAARHYLAARGEDRPCRFDVVLARGAGLELEWVQDAFGDDGGRL
ncbi:MAG TPA: YraN family protein [Burkholderiales bacterium]|nr:YraN family protein [Burkholderiales bacterium]